MPDSSPIGIFDSGIGGMSVMEKIRRLLPAEDIIYFADSAYCPYGNRSPEIVRNRAISICDFMVSNGVKMVVVASNTTSSAGLDELRKIYSIPIIGMEPAVKPAAEVTKNKKVGILATGVTLAGERYNSLLNRYGNGITVFSQPCPGLVELVEAGEVDTIEARAMLNLYLKPLINEGVDTIVLGCTHYPFLRPLVESILGNGVKVIETGDAVARHVVQILKEHNISTPNNGTGKETFYTSGNVETVRKVIKKFWFSKNSIVVKNVSPEL